MNDPLHSHRQLSIAPMLDWTDRHERYFLRLFSRNLLLYTEMITTGALLHGDAARLLAFNDEEHPVALQLGGCDPKAMAQCAKMAENCGYDEVNINVGCPSDRVQNGSFGACLMASPTIVGDCVKAMQDTASIPITVKCRVGIDHNDAYAPFEQFIDVVSNAGCEIFIIHARKAWLEGLSPKENRDIPPLRYEWVHRLKTEYPKLHISINGGIISLDQALDHLKHVDGVMIGRAAYQNPSMLLEADTKIWKEPSPFNDAKNILTTYMEYVEAQLSQGVYLGHMAKHVLGLYQGVPGARLFRRHISENCFKKNAGVEVLAQALSLIEVP